MLLIFSLLFVTTYDLVVVAWYIGDVAGWHDDTMIWWLLRLHVPQAVSMTILCCCVTVCMICTWLHRDVCQYMYMYVYVYVAMYVWSAWIWKWICVCVCVCVWWEGIYTCVCKGLSFEAWLIDTCTCMYDIWIIWVAKRVYRDVYLWFYKFSRVIGSYE